MATYWENSCSFGLRYVSWYKYLIVGLVFSHLGFWSGNLFLIAPFPDLCLLVPFCCSGLNTILTVVVMESIQHNYRPTFDHLYKKLMFNNDVAFDSLLCYFHQILYE